MTIESTAADIVDRLPALIADSKLNATDTIAGIIRNNLAQHPSLKQCCGCKAIWPTERIVFNTCPHCGGQCGGLRVAM